MFAPILVGLGVFWVVSIGTVLFGLNMGLRQGSNEVTADVIRIRQTSLFSHRLVELPRLRIVAVQSGPSRLSVGTSRGATRRAGGLSVDELHV